MKRIFLGTMLMVLTCLTSISNAVAPGYLMIDSTCINGEILYIFSVPQEGVYNIWIPTFTDSDPNSVYPDYPVNSQQFTDVIRNDFPYTFKINLNDYQKATPNFPKLRGKFWHAWTKLAQVYLTTQKTNTLTLLPDAGVLPAALPASVFITATDYCPPDTLMKNADDIWIEAEDASSHNFTAIANEYCLDDTLYGILNDPTKFGTGGGKVLRLNVQPTIFPTEGYFATYSFNVPGSGVEPVDYDLWYNGYAPNGKGWWASSNHSSFTWAIDIPSNKNQWPLLNPFGIEGRPDIYSHQSYGWYHLTKDVGEIALTPGNHTLYIQIEENQNVYNLPGFYEQMLDAFFFIKKEGTSNTNQKVPCDITASSQYLARISGLDQTNVFYPGDGTVLKIALDRDYRNSLNEVNLTVDYQIVDEYNNPNSSSGNLFFPNNGSITGSITIPTTWYTNPGLYHVIASFKNVINNEEVAYLDTYFGVVYETRYPGPKENSIFGAAQDAVLYEHLKKAGVKWVRSYKADWPTIERNGPDQYGIHTYNWNALDREIAKLKENDMNIICCVQHSAKWASNPPEGTPVDTFNKYYSVYPPKEPEWDYFIHDLVTLYKDDIHCWELWNEPWNWGYNWHADRFDYGPLAKTTYQAIKAVDNTALLGAYNWAINLYNTDFPDLDGIPGLDTYKDYFDANAFHPYTSSAPEGKYLQIWLPYAMSQASMSITGQEWETEQVPGFGLGIQYSNPQKYANWVVRTYTLAKVWGVTHYCYFDFDDWCLGEFGGGSGLINPDCTPRPGYIAYANMASLLEGTEFIDTIHIAPKIWAYAFEYETLPGQPDPIERPAIAVLWNTNGMKNTVSFARPIEFMALDIMGNVTGEIIGDNYSLDISSSPVYLKAKTASGLITALENINFIAENLVDGRHNIEPSSIGNGTISPSGTVTVGDEDMPSFTLTPSPATPADANKYCLNILVDGVKATDDNGLLRRIDLPTWHYTYTFSPVFRNHTLAVTFIPIIVSATVSGYGGTVSVSPASQPMSSGGTASIAITPRIGYEISTITDNGVLKSIANPYVINNVTSPHAVVVTFKRIGADDM